MVQGQNINKIQILAFEHDFAGVQDDVEKLIMEALEKNPIDGKDSRLMEVHVIKDIPVKMNIDPSEKNKLIMTDHNGTEVFSENVYIAGLGRFLFELDKIVKNAANEPTDEVANEESFRDFAIKINDCQNNKETRNDYKKYSQLFLDYISQFKEYLVDDYEEILGGENFDIKYFIKDKSFNWYFMPALIVKPDAFEKYFDDFCEKNKNEKNFCINENDKAFLMKFVELSKDEKIKKIALLRKPDKNQEEIEQCNKWFETFKKICNQSLKKTAVGLQETKVVVDNEEQTIVKFLSKDLDNVKELEEGNQVMTFTNNSRNTIETNVNKFNLVKRPILGYGESFFTANYDKNSKKISFEKHGVGKTKDEPISMDGFYTIYKKEVYEGKKDFSFSYFGDTFEDLNLIYKLSERIKKDAGRLDNAEKRLAGLKAIIKYDPEVHEGKSLAQIYKNIFNKVKSLNKLENEIEVERLKEMLVVQKYANGELITYGKKEFDDSNKTFSR